MGNLAEQLPGICEVVNALLLHYNRLYLDEIWGSQYELGLSDSVLHHKQSEATVPICRGVAVYNVPV